VLPRLVRSLATLALDLARARPGEQKRDQALRAAGIFLTFESFPDIELALESLDPRQGKRHPELD
jgi:polyisoprenoid-binding protein YceI